MLHDFRFALRMIRLHPWFAAAIVSVLALGIGANTAVFTLVNAVLLKPLPFKNGDRIVAVRHNNAKQGQERIPISYPDYLAYRDNNSTFESLHAYRNEGLAFRDRRDDPPQVYEVARVTLGFLDMLGMEPLYGRGFQADDAEAGSPPVLLLSHHMWRDRYGMDPEVVGSDVLVGGEPSTIIGILPEGFSFPGNSDLWAPLVDTPEIQQRTVRNLTGVGVRKPDVSIQQANADMRVISSSLATQFPVENEGREATVMTFHDLENSGPIRIVFYLMQGAVTFVLLIACANVANMMLSRALGRQRELSIRSALGASRWTLIRQLLVESVLLSFIGGALGLFLSLWAVRGFDAAVANLGKPSWIVFDMNWVAFAYFAGICLFSGLLFGLFPGLRASRGDLNEPLKEGSRDSGSKGSGFMSGALVVLQFTLALVLLAGSGLFVRELLLQRASQEGLPLDSVLMARIQLPSDRYPDQDARYDFYDRLLTEVRASSGAEQVELVSSPPVGGAFQLAYQVEGERDVEENQRPEALRLTSSPGYLSLMDIPIRMGRAFDDRDGLTGREAVIVTTDFAERIWPGESPLGKRLRFFTIPPGAPPRGADPPKAEPGPWHTVVGVSGDVEQRPSEASPPPLLFVPNQGTQDASMWVMLRSSGDPNRFAAPLRTALQKLDSDRALGDVRTLGDFTNNQTWYLRVFGTVFLIFAAGALLMASIGIYAVVAQNTTRRTREVGIRMALGATSSRILMLAMSRGVKQLIAGLLLGVVAAVLATRQMSDLLFNVSPYDPIVFGTVIVIISVVGLLACWLPARRASNLDPLRALHYE